METWKKKICLIGSDGVGKTSIIIRYTQGTFSNSYLMTLGVDFYEIEKKILQNNKEIDLNLVVWDIASQKNFEKIRSHYLQHANLVIIVADVNRLEPKNFIEPWISDIKTNSPPNCPYIIVVNKSDLIDLEDLKKSVEKLKSKYKNVKIFYSSAKSGKNINSIFEYVADYLVNGIDENQIK
ncbi:MAG: Rab family GTPase [Promethearchaeota archaeon]